MIILSQFKFRFVKVLIIKTKGGYKMTTVEALRKELNKDLYEIKEDLFNNTLKSNEKYHDWINKHRNNIYPSQPADNF